MIVVIIIIVLGIVGFIIYRKMSWRKMEPGHGTDPGRVMDLTPKKDDGKKTEARKTGYLTSSIPMDDDDEDEESEKEEVVVVILKEDRTTGMQGKWICRNCDTINQNANDSCDVCMMKK